MYVVTGATSRTGSVVANALLREGASVRVVGRSHERLLPLVEAGAEAFVGDPLDKKAMEDAFEGAEAAWVMLQPNYIPDSPDFRGFQTAVIQSVVPAISKAGVSKVVSLSSWGAGAASGTGPVLGLHDLEQALNATGMDVLHLRAGYYMENMLAYADAIAANNTPEGAFKSDVPMPFIATKDVGTAGGEALLDLSFSGVTERELQGPCDLTFDEAFNIISNLLGRSVSYREISMEEAAKQWIEAGLAQNVVDLMTEVVLGINQGVIATEQPRSAETTTPTTFEEFAKEQLIPLC